MIRDAIAEADLVDRLRGDGDALVELIAVQGELIVGHILFSRLWIGPTPTAALAPIAVNPERQREGVGSALVRTGVERCRSASIPAIVVLGHPDYYPRFGFSVATAQTLGAPFSGPSFMAMELVPGALATGGRVRYVAAFGL